MALAGVQRLTCSLPPALGLHSLTHSLSSSRVSTAVSSHRDREAGRGDLVFPMISTTPVSRSISCDRASLRWRCSRGLPAVAQPHPTRCFAVGRPPLRSASELRDGKPPGPGSKPRFDRTRTGEPSKPAEPLAVPVWMAKDLASPDVQVRLRALDRWVAQGGASGSAGRGAG
jgi:hypothetical protein